jgi:hypothetical protein
VIKNTAVKIVHRLPAADDLKELARDLDDHQLDALLMDARKQADRCLY